MNYEFLAILITLLGVAIALYRVEKKLDEVLSLLKPDHQLNTEEGTSN